MRCARLTASREGSGVREENRGRGSDTPVCGSDRVRRVAAATKTRHRTEEGSTTSRGAARDRKPVLSTRVRFTDQIKQVNVLHTQGILHEHDHFAVHDPEHSVRRRYPGVRYDHTIDADNPVLDLVGQPDRELDLTRARRARMLSDEAACKQPGMANDVCRQWRPMELPLELERKSPVSLLRPTAPASREWPACALWRRARQRTGSTGPDTILGAWPGAVLRATRW